MADNKPVLAARIEADYRNWNVRTYVGLFA